MRTKVLAAILAGGFAITAGTAMADGPMRLTDGEMDGISAGAIALGTGTAGALGDVISSTSSVSAATVVGSTLAAAANTSTAVAASLLFPAAAATTSASAAALP